MQFISAVGLALVIPNAPVDLPQLTNVHVARSASYAPSTATLAVGGDGLVFPASLTLAERGDGVDAKKALNDFVQQTTKVVNENAPIVQKKFETEVLPTLDKALKQAQVEEQAFLDKQGPAIQKAADELAPVIKEQAMVAGSIALKTAGSAAVSIGGVAFDVAKAATVAAVSAAKDAATPVVVQAENEITKVVNEKVTPDSKKFLEETGSQFVKAATPIVDEGVKAATPVVNDAVKVATKKGALLLKKGLAELNAQLAALAPDEEDAPADTARAEAEAKLEKLKAERAALMAQ